MGDRATHADRTTSPGVAPSKIDPTSIDLRLDQVREAKIWNVDSFKNRHDMAGIAEPELHLGASNSANLAESTSSRHRPTIKAKLMTGYA